MTPEPAMHGHERLDAGKRRSAVTEDRRGFVLALVVLMLFAISVTAATGYLIVETEYSMARHAGQGAEALVVARAGLQRFVAEQLGSVGDSVSYAIGDGVALVTARRVLERDAGTDVYYIRSEGTLADYFAPATPARRVVGAYAYHHLSPLAHHAAWVVAAEGAFSDSPSGLVSGTDASDAGACPWLAGPGGGRGGGRGRGGGPPIGGPPITGAVARTSTAGLSGGTLEGAPSGETWSGGFAEIYDSVGLRWDVLSDPSFPVDFDGVQPDFGALPSDSFPVVRVDGYFNPGSSWSGRGVLIVNGELDASSSFSWDGIILAGALADIHEGNVRGMVVGGLDGPNPASNVYWRGSIRYYSCLVDEANRSLSYLELVDNTVFEAY